MIYGTRRAKAGILTELRTFLAACQVVRSSSAKNRCLASDIFFVITIINYVCSKILTRVSLCLIFNIVDTEIYTTVVERVVNIYCAITYD